MKAFTRRAAAVLAGLALLAMVPAYHPGEAHAQVVHTEDVTAVVASPIWRAQITIQVGNVGNAGTDDGVRVELSPTNSTWLDYARDDFERNSSFTYH
jgi:hypothetical protein